MEYIWNDVNTQWGRQKLTQDMAAVEFFLEAGLAVIVHCRRGWHRTGAFYATLRALSKDTQGKGLGTVSVSLGVVRASHENVGVAIHSFVFGRIRFGRLGVRALNRTSMTSFRNSAACEASGGIRITPGRATT